MGKLQTAMLTRRVSGDRDHTLRAAHQAAFDKILRARQSPGYREAVKQAVDDLIEACEAYTAHH
ncbi:MAG: hypothetical protein ACRDKZ_10260 [Actinomycetota bacterium]